MRLKLALAGAAAITLTLVGAVSAQAMSAQATSAQTPAAQTASAASTRLGAAPSAAVPFPAGPSSAAAPAGFVRLSGGPSEPAVNPATDTLYVPLHCTETSCSSEKYPDVVDIISTATCNGQHVSGCRVVATAKVGLAPLAAVVDKSTDTVYVTSEDYGHPGLVSVLDGARCNAQVTSGCARPVATFRVPQHPLDGVVNPRTHTLYIPDDDGISVINTAKCNAKVTSGCGATPRTIPDPGYDSWVDVDIATDTVYVANYDGNYGEFAAQTGSMSVINGATCNASIGTSCAKIPFTVRVGYNALTLAVDQSTNTIYVSSYGDGSFGGSVSVINGKTCDRFRTSASGCKTLADVITGAGPGQVTVDSRRHTAFVVNAGDDTVSAINTKTCNGTVTAGCARRPRNEQAAPVRGAGFDSFVNALALDPASGTLYVLDDGQLDILAQVGTDEQGGANVLSVDGTGRCNAIDTAGCRVEAPQLAERYDLFAADPATHTFYAADEGGLRIDVINSATCNAGNRSGCAPIATIPAGGLYANPAIDEATHTLYTTTESGKLSVINIAACNATDTAGCRRPVAEVKIGAVDIPDTPVINPATRTLYVSYAQDSSRIAVVNIATCNAAHRAGCGQAHATVKVGEDTDHLAVSVATNTVYAATTGFPEQDNGHDFRGHSVAVINGATCDAADTSGCGHLAAKATVGSAPEGIVVNDATHTAYVANSAFADGPGTVSVINTATCDGTRTSGCHATFPVMPAGVSPTLAALDPADGRLYVTDFHGATVTVLGTARCNAEITSGCGQPGREQAVGSNPDSIIIDGCSVYVGQDFNRWSMAIFRA